MSASWVAGQVRAKALARRRIGSAAAREIATCPGLGDALDALAAGPYRDASSSRTLDDAERAVAATLLWNLRVLAGWQPARGAGVVRLLAGGFEVSNVEEHARALAGQDGTAPYRLGALSTSWNRLGTARSLAELRAALAASPWGDPGSPAPQGIAVGMRLSWAGRVAGGVPEAAQWACGAAVLLVATERFLASRELVEPVAERARVLLGPAAVAALSWRAFVSALPASLRWPLAGVTDPGDLWLAENRWWYRVDRDASALLRGPAFSPAAVVGVTGALAADAWRVRAALQVAARGGGPVEAFDALG